MGKMQEFLKKMGYLGVDLASQTIDKIEETIDELVKKGEVSEKEGKKIVTKILKKTEKKKDYLESKINKVLEDLKDAIPSKKKKGIKDLLSEDELEDELHIDDKKDK